MDYLNFFAQHPFTDIFVLIFVCLGSEAVFDGIASCIRAWRENSQKG